MPLIQRIAIIYSLKESIYHFSFLIGYLKLFSSIINDKLKMENDKCFL